MKSSKKILSRLAVLFVLLITLQACDVWTDESSSSSSSQFDPSNAQSNPSDLSASSSIDSSVSTSESTHSDSHASAGSETATTSQDNQTMDPSPSWKASFTPVNVDPNTLQAAVDESGSWQRWPSTAITPVELDIDLSAYQGQSRDNRSLEGITVILDPGHGGKDPGAIALHEGLAIYEKDINLAIALQTKDQLEALGARVIMTRTDDSWVSLYQRVAVAAVETINFWEDGLQEAALDNAWLAPIKTEVQKLIDINEDSVESGGRGFAQGMGVVPELRLLMDAQGQTDHILFVSIHANSTDVNVEDKRGLQMYISTNQIIYDSEREMIQLDPNDPEITPVNPNYTGYNDAARLKLANALYGGITDLVPSLRQGEITAFAGNFAFLRELNLTSVLVETGFMSNASDLAILLDPVQQAFISAGIADGVWRYFTQ